MIIKLFENLLPGSVVSVVYIYVVLLAVVFTVDTILLLTIKKLHPDFENAYFNYNKKNGLAITSFQKIFLLALSVYVDIDASWRLAPLGGIPVMYLIVVFATGISYILFRFKARRLR